MLSLQNFAIDVEIKPVNFMKDHYNESDRKIGVCPEECDVTIALVNDHGIVESTVLKNMLHTIDKKGSGTNSDGFEEHLNEKKTAAILSDVLDITKPEDTVRKSRAKMSTELYLCSVCRAAFTVKQKRRNHERKFHGMHQFVCIFCEKSFPQKKHLSNHVLIHKGPNGFVCGICGKLRSNYIKMRRHLKSHAEKNIPCVNCGACFKTHWELKSHEIQHEVNRQFNCQKCDLTFINPTKLRKHMNAHFGAEPFNCEICGKNFNTPGNLKSHKKIHLEAKPFKCQYCSLGFFSNTARKKHLTVHEIEKHKPYECNDCGKKYTSTTSFAVHRMKFHPKDLAYQCHYCKKKFSTEASVIQHGNEHAAERPHSCPKCPCRYKNKRELRRHQRDKNHFDDTKDGASRKNSFEILRPFEGDILEEDWEIPEPEVCIKESDG